MQLMEIYPPVPGEGQEQEGGGEGQEGQEGEGQEGEGQEGQEGEGQEGREGQEGEGREGQEGEGQEGQEGEGQEGQEGEGQEGQEGEGQEGQEGEGQEGQEGEGQEGQEGEGQEGEGQEGEGHRGQGPRAKGARRGEETGAPTGHSRPEGAASLGRNEEVGEEGCLYSGGNLCQAWILADGEEGLEGIQDLILAGGVVRWVRGWPWMDATFAAMVGFGVYCCGLCWLLLAVRK
ncbi:uncharacterized protein H6S33_007789 [Morchella sextelata]|uniref:uncharacterized protein n=1 Tax=Morchella sextelata TaxID=1174677 RepID=UPI001D0493D5|nr:uncharacterized protein H6S33_007789 [Morchella sextelata]KAH0603467.1 hypothetical protein H6S33_007789 [Morchella sextelata]